MPCCQCGKIQPMDFAPYQGVWGAILKHCEGLLGHYSEEYFEWQRSIPSEFGGLCPECWMLATHASAVVVSSSSSSSTSHFRSSKTHSPKELEWLLLLQSMQGLQLAEAVPSSCSSGKVTSLHSSQMVE